MELLFAKLFCIFIFGPVIIRQLFAWMDHLLEEIVLPQTHSPVVLHCNTLIACDCILWCLACLNTSPSSSSHSPLQCLILRKWDNFCSFYYDFSSTILKCHHFQSDDVVFYAQGCIEQCNTFHPCELKHKKTWALTQTTVFLPGGLNYLIIGVSPCLWFSVSHPVSLSYSMQLQQSHGCPVKGSIQGKLHKSWSKRHLCAVNTLLLAVLLYIGSKLCTCLSTQEPS